MIVGSFKMICRVPKESTNLLSIWHFPVIKMQYLLKFQDLGRICHGTSPGLKANDQELNQNNTGERQEVCEG